MSKLNSVFVAKVNAYTGSNDNPATADKNGKMPVILNVLGGSAPNARILSGTIAENEGFTVGKAFVVSCSETETDPEHGRRFRFSNAGELNVMDTIDLLTSGKMSAPEIVDVTSAHKKTAKKDF